MADISRLDLLTQLHSNAFVFQTGIERETLRVSKDGNISQQPHPAGLGSALTHSAITTDYSESLLEFITGVHTDKTGLLNELDELHRFTFSKMDDELLWANSMPSVLPGQEQIPIAQYGNSNIGKLKTIYRKGLWHRYGRKMQTISGVHYNWSLTDEFWRQWALMNGKSGDLTDFKTKEYFGLIRNFRRHSWLLLYLFGASPAADRSFTDHDVEGLNKLGDDTLQSPYATSLRMSDLGYSNKAQAELFVCFNCLETYTETLSKAIESPYPAYETIGLKEGDNYKQLNTSILQIENEYYSDIRPKRVAFSGEKPLHALRNRGVEYIEVRCLDVNPFLPYGIDETQMNFVDLFLLWCLVQDSPKISSAECAELKRNTENVAASGRHPELTIDIKTVPKPMAKEAESLIESIAKFAATLDDKHSTEKYRQTCDIQKAKVTDVNKTPSAQVASNLTVSNSFREFSLERSNEFADYFSQPLSKARIEHWEGKSALSSQLQKDIEMSDKEQFSDFLKEYLRQ